MFGNDGSWIDRAIERALGVAKNAGLEVYIVGHRGGVEPGVVGIIDRWNARSRKMER